MLMGAFSAVKALAVAGGLKLKNLPLCGKQVKVAVHRPQTYARQALADHGIDLIRRGMCDDFSQFFKNDGTLSCYALLMLHSDLLSVDSKNYRY